MSKSEVTIELRGNITRRGLELLCMLYDISIIFIYGKMYNKFNHNYDCSEKINGMIKYDTDCKYYLCFIVNLYHSGFSLFFHEAIFCLSGV